MAKFGKSGVYGKLQSLKKRRLARKQARSKKIQRMKAKYRRITTLPKKMQKLIKRFEREKASFEYIKQGEGEGEYLRTQVLFKIICEECKDEIHNFLVFSRERKRKRKMLNNKRRFKESLKLCLNEVKGKNENEVEEFLSIHFSNESGRFREKLSNFISLASIREIEVGIQGLLVEREDEKKLAKEIEELDLMIESSFEDVFVYSRDNRKISIFDLNFGEEFSSFVFNE